MAGDFRWHCYFWSSCSVVIQGLGAWSSSRCTLCTVPPGQALPGLLCSPPCNLPHELFRREALGKGPDILLGSCCFRAGPGAACSLRKNSKPRLTPLQLSMDGWLGLDLESSTKSQALQTEEGGTRRSFSPLGNPSLGPGASRSLL